MKKSKKVVAACLLALCMALGAIGGWEMIANAAAVSLEDVMRAETYSDPTVAAYDMPYRIYVPDSYDERKQYKLLFMLHGAGERGSDNTAPVAFATAMPFAKKIVTDPVLKEEYIILVPQCPVNDKWVQTEWIPGRYDFKNTPQTSAAKLAAGILFQTILEYNVDMRKIFITGLSMGGYGTYDFLARYPGLFAAALPMCGGCDPDTASDVALTPLWAFHCKNDDVVHYGGNLEMVNTLKEMGAGVLYTEYDGIGHDSWKLGYKNENAFWWMNGQRRAHAYWKKVPVEPDASDPAKPAVLSCNMAAQGTAFVSNESPTGSGNKDLAVLSDGFFDGNGYPNDKQYDTYGNTARHYDWFGYAFTSNVTFTKLVYQAGMYFAGGGGWFAEGVRVQVSSDGNDWTDVTMTGANPYPVIAEGADPDANTIGFETFVFEFEPVSAKYVRIYGLAGGAQYFASCAELEVYGNVTVADGNIARASMPKASVMNVAPNLGVGSHNVFTFIDGMRGVSGNNASQYDTYYNDWAPAQDAWFSLEFADTHEFNRLVYQAGMYFVGGGGWFAGGLRVQVRSGGTWTDVTLTGANPYPVIAENATAIPDGFEPFGVYEFAFEPMRGDAIRIFGRAGGSSHFTSCAELEVYCTDVSAVEISPPTGDGYTVISDFMRTFTEEEIRDKIKGGWVGQMAGVVWGARDEFAFKGTMIPDNRVPDYSTLDINAAYEQDDLYVEIPFIDALVSEGFDVSVETLGDYFADTAFPLWHANDVARNNIKNGIPAPLSGSYLYSSCCDDIDWQIEADFVGSIYIGQVRNAVQKAFDWGHVMCYGDGVYGGVFVSAMHAKAFSAENVLSVVNTGIASIPQNTKFRALLDDILNWYCNDVSFKDCWQMLENKWGGDDRCVREGSGPSAAFNIDAKLNAGYCLMGLLYGAGDFGESMRLSMICGQDSDCNPSTVGGILGNYFGFDALDPVWSKGLDMHRAFSYTEYSLQDVLAIHYDLAVQALQENGGKIEAGVWVFGEEEATVPVAPYEQWAPMPSLEYALHRTNKTLAASVSVYYEKGVRSIEWDFGDGAAASGARVEHTYKLCGNYTVTLTVTGKDGTVATRTVPVLVEINNNFAGAGKPIVSNTSPTGAGGKDINVIKDGIIGSTSTSQYDTYGVLTEHYDFFGYEFAERHTFNRVVFTAGSYFDNGGWFANGDVKVQVYDGEWKDVTLTAPSGYPVGNTRGAVGREYESYTFAFEETEGTKIRVYGKAGGSANFASCSELEVFGVVQIGFDTDEVTYDTESGVLVLSYTSGGYAVTGVRLGDTVVSDADYTADAATISFERSFVLANFAALQAVTVTFENNETSTVNVALDFARAFCRLTEAIPAGNGADTFAALCEALAVYEKVLDKQAVESHRETLAAAIAAYNAHVSRANAALEDASRVSTDALAFAFAGVAAAVLVYIKNTIGGGI